MLTYMDYVQQAFYKATNWNEDNSYANLTATARGTINFPHRQCQTAMLCLLRTG